MLQKLVTHQLYGSNSKCMSYKNSLLRLKDHGTTPASHTNVEFKAFGGVPVSKVNNCGAVSSDNDCRFDLKKLPLYVALEH